MAKTVDLVTSANERRAKLAAERLEKREAVLAEMPEFGRIAQALRELGESVTNPVVRREVLALAESVQRAFDLRQQQADLLAGPGLSELLLPIGVSNRLREAEILSVQQIRRALAEGGSKLRRLPSVGSAACDLIRAHLEALDAGEAPPPKLEIRGKNVALTEREKVLADRLGLSAEQAGELLKGAGRSKNLPKE